MDDNIKDLIDDDDLAQTLVMRNAQLRVLRNQRVEWIKERRELRAELDDCKKWKDITASNHNHLRQQVINHLAEIRQLRQALEAVAGLMAEAKVQDHEGVTATFRCEEAGLIALEALKGTGE